MTLDATTRRQLIDFELGLQAAIGDEVVEGDWGRACLTPSLPMAWDASWIAIEEPGMAAPELAALSDEVMGGAGFSHRNVHVCDEADGRRLAAEAESLPGWEAGRIDYMVWRGDSGRRPAVAVDEAKLAEIATLRLELIGEPFPVENANREQIVAQLFERDGRLGEGGGDRWFVAPADQPAAACRLLRSGGHRPGRERRDPDAGAKRRSGAGRDAEGAGGVPRGRTPESPSSPPTATNGRA